MTAYNFGQLIFVDIGGLIVFVSCDFYSVADYRDSIRNFKNLIYLRAYENNGDSLFFKLPYDCEKTVNLLSCKRGRGFVHNKKLCVGSKRPCYGYKLTVRD